MLGRSGYGLTFLESAGGDSEAVAVTYSGSGECVVV